MDAAIEEVSHRSKKPDVMPSGCVRIMLPALAPFCSFSPVTKLVKCIKPCFCRRGANQPQNGPKEARKVINATAVKRLIASFLRRASVADLPLWRRSPRQQSGLGSSVALHLDRPGGGRERGGHPGQIVAGPANRRGCLE